MTDPLDTDDDWAELARELDRDKPPAARTWSKRSPLSRTTATRARKKAAAEGKSENAADEEFEDAEEARRVRRVKRLRRANSPAAGASGGVGVGAP